MDLEYYGASSQRVVPSSSCWHPPRPPPLQQTPMSKHASPSAPACSPPARSGPDRLRLPPQFRPQSMHPVLQNISGHSEVCGDVGVSPAVYNPALQQDAVVIVEIPEDGAKPIRGSLHWGDLGGQDDTPGPRLVSPVLLLPSGRFGPRHTWKHVQGQGSASEIPRRAIFSCGDALQGGWGFLDLYAVAV